MRGLQGWGGGRLAVGQFTKQNMDQRRNLFHFMGTGTSFLCVNSSGGFNSTYESTPRSDESTPSEESKIFSLKTSFVGTGGVEGIQTKLL
jgi:hypothetical protein